jgi:hypothetical protein
MGLSDEHAAENALPTYYLPDFGVSHKLFGKISFGDE